MKEVKKENNETKRKMMKEEQDKWMKENKEI